MVINALDQKQDRVTLFESFPSSGCPQGTNHILPINKMTRIQQKNILDSILSSAALPESQNLAQAIEQARNHLKDPFTQLGAKEVGYTTLRHVLVLTSNLDDVPIHLHDMDGIGLHVICPGVVPWQSLKASYWKGWHVYQYPATPDKHNSKTLMYHDEFKITINTLISNLRHGATRELLTELELSIKSSQHCTILDIVGQCSIPALQPGGFVTVLVKLKLRDTSTNRHSSSKSSQSQHSALKSIDLADHKTKGDGRCALSLLRVRLRYKHSVLPQGTTCEISEEAFVSITSEKPTPLQSSSQVSLGVNRIHDKKALLVQRSLIYRLATLYGPDQALKTLCEYFDPQTTSLLCPQYLQLVMDELKYQCRVTERLGLADQYYMLPSLLSERMPVRTITHGQDIGSALLGGKKRLSKNFNKRAVPVSPLSNGEPSDEITQVWSNVNKPMPRKMSLKQILAEGPRATNTTNLSLSSKHFGDLTIKSKGSLSMDSLESIVATEMKKENSPWL